MAAAFVAVVDVAEMTVEVRGSGKLKYPQVSCRLGCDCDHESSLDQIALANQARLGIDCAWQDSPTTVQSTGQGVMLVGGSVDVDLPEKHPHCQRCACILVVEVGVHCDYAVLD